MAASASWRLRARLTVSSSRISTNSTARAPTRAKAATWCRKAKNAPTAGAALSRSAQQAATEPVQHAGPARLDAIGELTGHVFVGQEELAALRQTGCPDGWRVRALRARSAPREFPGTISTATRVTACGQSAGRSVKASRPGLTISIYAPVCSMCSPSLRSTKRNVPLARASIVTDVMGRAAVANSQCRAISGSSQASKTRSGGASKVSLTRTRA